MIKQAHPYVAVTGIDGDAQVLEIARSKAIQAGVRIILEQGQACQLPYLNNWLDRV